MDLPGSVDSLISRIQLLVLLVMFLPLGASIVLQWLTQRYIEQSWGAQARRRNRRVQ